jgi:basic membrane protein A and related proteins
MIPDVFCASALAQIDRAVFRAITDMVAGQVPGRIVEMGLAQDDNSVGLSLHPDLETDHRDAISVVAKEIASRTITVPVAYDGPEFTLQTGEASWTEHA